MLRLRHSNTEDERVATPARIRRRGRLGLLVWSAVAALLFVAGASADDNGTLYATSFDAR